MSKYEGHTPGPWFVHDLRGMGGPISISCTTPDHITVADIGPGIENTEAEALANARLIAAAPGLLAERDRLLEVLKELQECSAYWSEYDVPIGIHERIQAAIASAESPQDNNDE